MFPIRCDVLNLIALLGVFVGSHSIVTAATEVEEREFFEKRVRPVLVERCYRCHSSQADKVKGGLSLDSKSAITQGGDGGIIVVPGKPDESRLIEAIRYANPDLQMPPKGKLPDQEIHDLTTWVQMGAPWPSDGSEAIAVRQEAFDLQARRQSHWSWKPIRQPQVPEVTSAGWSRNEVDQFILARLEQSQIPPAKPADKRTLLRRLSFDLTGLPPTPEALERWLNDASEQGFERAVDQLLASPHFGERWARHWLDLVRYSETLGHEFDYTNPNAWRYRDYVIRALNSDVPYDQFVREHIAGDLLTPARYHPVDGSNESVIGTAFYWLGQRDHSPVDVRLHQAELIDNQIDVLTKTFLGLTVSCARCHDHKFDAISTQDYYSLYGILSSSRYTQAALHRPETLSDTSTKLADLKSQYREDLGSSWTKQAERVAEYLRSAQAAKRSNAEPAQLESLVLESGLDPTTLKHWHTALSEEGSSKAGHPLYLWTRWHQENQAAKVDPRPPEESAAPKLGIAGHQAFVDLRSQNKLAGWFFEGEAFQQAAGQRGDVIPGRNGLSEPLILEAPALHSGLLSRRLQGALRSPTFIITNRYIHILAAGRNARINVPVDNFTMIRDPIYGGLKRILNHDDFRWITIDLDMWKGHRTYLEFSDLAAPDPADDGHRSGFGTDGYLGFQQILFSDEAEPPSGRTGFDITSGLGESPAASSKDLAARYQQMVQTAVKAWSDHSSSKLSPAQARLLNWMVQKKLFRADDSESLRQLAADFKKVEDAVPDPTRVPAMTEGTGLDERVFVRGSHRLPGQPAPRRFLTAIGGTEQAPIQHGSGRLELAERMLDPDNPFLARVIVNRVWGHLFGRGIVPTPDDFGVLGQTPTHPELLDWLAHWFRSEGQWSVKKLIRVLVTSRTYAMSTSPSDRDADLKDPENLLWHRMPLRRLEGESIRDTILAISGRMNPSMYGEPVPIHLTDFMDGRGRPPKSGPLDGDGRRSIYLEVRRNFVSPMMRAFDMPVPFTTIGRRTVSNVPAQSLFLLNDPFVIAEAERWARRALARTELSPTERIRWMYRTAFNREATSTEIAEGLAFLDEQTKSYAAIDPAKPVDGSKPWADLAHVLFNVKEFVFLN